MPTFLDAHPMGTVEEETLKQAQKMPKGADGVTHKNIIYNKKENKVFCLLDAPSKEAVEKHHEGLGMKCDWVMEVQTTS